MYIWIFITVPNKKVASTISSFLLKKKLIACANMFPVSSAYWWKKKIHRHDEVAMILKTLPSKKKQVFSAVKRIHPYELPDLTSFSLSTTKEVENWIASSLK